jgi:hypothetical protein
VVIALGRPIRTAGKLHHLGTCLPGEGEFAEPAVGSIRTLLVSLSVIISVVISYSRHDAEVQMQEFG